MGYSLIGYTSVSLFTSHEDCYIQSRIGTLFDPPVVPTALTTNTHYILVLLPCLYSDQPVAASGAL